jgi:gluconolactonase
VWTGGQWLEGPAWSNQGQYLVFSDVLAGTLYRYIWDDGRVTKFKDPSYNANGNTVDFQGRLVSCQGLFRRIVRWENDGTMTVLADSYQGKKLNSPNGAVPHPDGSVWFTDPPYGDQLLEGHVDEIGGPANPGHINPLVGNPIGVPLGGTKRELPNATYRLDPGGTLSVVATEAMVPDPNGLDFSPDYKTFYLISTGKGPGDTGPGGKGIIFAFDVTGSGAGTTLTNQRVFTDMMVDGLHIGPDDMRVDVDGNVWASASGPLGYSGVLIFNPAGKLIGRIRLPEICANMSFGGPKRNVLFMCASQSLYMLTTGTQGAHPG